MARINPSLTCLSRTLSAEPWRFIEDTVYLYAKDVSRIFTVAEALDYGMLGGNSGLISTEDFYRSRVFWRGERNLAWAAKGPATVSKNSLHSSITALKYICLNLG